MERLFRPDVAVEDPELAELEELLPAPGRRALTDRSTPATARQIATRILARLGERIGAGDGLPPELRARFQRALGLDLGDVRVHTDGGAGAAARALGARAFALGDDIFVDGEADEQLLAHEVAHTVQQRGAPVAAPGRTRPGDAVEREAGEVAGAMLRGAPARVSAAPLAVAGEWTGGSQRLPDQSDQPAAPGERVRTLDRTDGTEVTGPAAIRLYEFPGRDESQRILLVGGIHGDERAGVQIVDIILGRLRGGMRSRYQVWVLPTLFPDNIVTRHRTSPRPGERDRVGTGPRGRVDDGIDPNRDLPNAASSAPEQPRLHENQILLKVIQELRPTRIVQVHSTTNADWAGITRDVAGPRPADHGASATDEDAQLARRMAQGVRDRNQADMVRGNEGDAVEWRGPANREPAVPPSRTSLGEYGVQNNISVITVEARGDRASGDRGASSDRPAELMALAEVIEQYVLEAQEAPPGAPQAPPAGGQRQQSTSGPALVDGDQAQRVAGAGFAGAAGALPHLDAVQRAFGRHDLTGVRAHVGGAAAEASAALGARAYAAGDQVAFARDPDLFLVAHEAAHVVQQRGGVQLAGGVGQAGDVHERHADEVATAVVRGASAEALLDRRPGGGGGGPAIQRFHDGQTPEERAAEARQRLDQLAGQPEEAQRAEIRSWTAEHTRTLLDSVSAADRVNHAPLLRLISAERTASAAEGAEGRYRWVRSGPTRDEDEGTQQSAPSDYGPARSPGRTDAAPEPNDFARWVRGEGPPPNDSSAMNCWEAVFYSAFRAGIVPQSFLRTLHERAAAAGRGARRGAEQTSRTPEAGTPREVGADAYYQVLEAALGLPGAVDITNACPSLNRGDIVFFNGRSHVAVATGGGNQIQSLWVIPDQGPARRDSFQATTVEELLQAMERNLMPRPRVQVAPCPW